MIWHDNRGHTRCSYVSTIMAQLPDELVLSILDQRFPCRQQQTRALATLISVSLCTCLGPSLTSVLTSK